MARGASELFFGWEIRSLYTDAGPMAVLHLGPMRIHMGHAEILKKIIIIKNKSNSMCFTGSLVLSIGMNMGSLRKCDWVTFIFYFSLSIANTEEKTALLHNSFQCSNIFYPDFIKIIEIFSFLTFDSVNQFMTMGHFLSASCGDKSLRIT